MRSLEHEPLARGGCCGSVVGREVRTRPFVAAEVVPNNAEFSSGARIAGMIALGANLPGLV